MSFDPIHHPPFDDFFTGNGDLVADIQREMFTRMEILLAEVLVAPASFPTVSGESHSYGSWFAHLLGGFAFCSLVLFSTVSAQGMRQNAQKTLDPAQCVGAVCGERAAPSVDRFHTAAPILSKKPSTRASQSPSVSSRASSSSSSAKQRSIFQRFRMAPENFVSSSVPSERSDNKMGVYLTAGSVKRKQFFDESIQATKLAGGNAVVFDVKGGIVFFDSTSPLAKEWGIINVHYDLPAILAELHAQGIYTIARFVAIKDQNLIDKHPEFSVRSPKTNNLIINGWIDPAHPTAIAYNMEVVCDLARMGMREINFDYIRFSTANPVALSVIPTEDKAARVETFVRAARETIDRCGPQTKLGLSTYAILGWNREINLPNLGQDVASLAKYVDVISPMAYPATFAEGAYYVPGKHPGPRAYYLVYRTLEGYKEWIGPEHVHKLRPWLQAYGFAASDIQAEIRAVYDAGGCGFQFWNANNNYDPAYKAMKSMDVPERCLEQ